jgi:porphobilinogen synthase
VALLVKAAVSHAGWRDIVALSDMMDRVGAIREALDAACHEETAIMSCAAKFASAFMARWEAAESPPKYDRRTYQMDPANASGAP